MQAKILPFGFALILFISCFQIVGQKPQKVEDIYLPDGDKVEVKVWVQDLEIPWSLVFLPDGRALVSERPGRIRLIENGKLVPEPYMIINVKHIGEGGLMGLAVHPDFPNKPYIYAMYTYESDGKIFNRVIRIKDEGRKGVFDKVIIDSILGARFHNGGRIKFGPDKMLYITTGEIFKGELAQDLNSLNGKILRLTPDGEIPSDNPFPNSPIYSYGHRNPQGLAWHPETGDLFESEHGPSGEYGRFGHDEINIIVKGGNYGWPKVIGAPGEKEYIDPIVVWKDATPPSGMTFYKGDLFVATLRSEALIRIKLQRSGKSYKVTKIERWFAFDKRRGKYGRLRDVVVGPDGNLYVLTSNRDGRGNPQPGDDKIYQIIFKK
ncbi:Glucose/arabinose dehydrogenase, beta-propeller fold [Candidatus Thermokryptus mobilis]|uniref:Glucose/arabinose dehydrogenase, beta-propeller fold n=1 Tax=Candidatus Thermokryptus mobilis TaxID=1643428 RepID=A0A0S4MTY8_9BACT|nr:PQQ-dependent sugar dehydrogenase [Candidatus Thermokryptus mobilis]CUU02471.1 Glucose/arabinose dehydrogenase, beta-propeller fold [Candidatus Thermokryptus mobilis]